MTTDITQTLARIRELHNMLWIGLPERSLNNYSEFNQMHEELMVAIEQHIAAQDKQLAELEETLTQARAQWAILEPYCKDNETDLSAPWTEETGIPEDSYLALQKLRLLLLGKVESEEP